MSILRVPIQPSPKNPGRPVYIQVFQAAVGKLRFTTFVFLLVFLFYFSLLYLHKALTLTVTKGECTLVTSMVAPSQVPSTTDRTRKRF
jgi:hypothetical protein